MVLGATSKSRWAYAASKMMDEFYGLAYHQEYGLPVVPFRLFNTVGPRQTGHYGMVIPRLVNQALDNERITVYGDGTQRRCFCDVADAVRAIVGLARHPEAPGKVYNVGSTQEVSIRELAERIKIMTAHRRRSCWSRTPRPTRTQASRTWSAANPTRGASTPSSAGAPRTR